MRKLTPEAFNILKNAVGLTVAQQIQNLSWDNFITKGVEIPLAPTFNSIIDLNDVADADYVVISTPNIAPSALMLTITQFDNFPDHPIVFLMSGNATFEFIDKSIAGGSANIKLEATPTPCDGNTGDMIVFEKRVDGNIYITNVRNYLA